MVKRLNKSPKKKASPDVQRLTISLPSALYSEVELIASRDSRSLGWVIRKAVEKLVADEQPLFHKEGR